MEKRPKNSKRARSNTSPVAEETPQGNPSWKNWQKLIEAVPDPMWVKDAYGRYVAANQAYLDVDAICEGTVLGKTDAEAFEPEKAALYAADDRIAVRDGCSEHKFKGVDGTGRVRYFLTKKSVLRDEQGTLIGIIAIARDVTDLHRFQKDLEHETVTSHTLFRILEAGATSTTVGSFLAEALSAVRHLLDCAQGSIFSLDRDHGQARLVSAQGDVAVIQSMPAVIGVDGEPYADVYLRGEPFLSGDWHVEGQEKPFAIAVAPLITDGRVVGSLNIAWHTPFSFDETLRGTLDSISREISICMDRIRAANSWVESEANLEIFFDAVPEIILVIDMDGRILAANDYAARCLRYTVETLTTMNITDLRPAEERRIALDVMRAMATGTRASRFENLVTSAGGCIAVETTVTRGSWKSAPAIFSISRDRTSEPEQLEKGADG